jgi:nitrous oxidase accessory protein
MLPYVVIACLGLCTLGVQAAELLVGQGLAFTSLKTAIASAAAGDTISVNGGHYAEGNLQITKPLTIIGRGNPVFDGEFKCEIFTISASNVTIRGVTLINGGRSSTKELAGIRVEAGTNIVITDNRLIDCNYGIYLAKARKTEVQRNIIEGKPDKELNSGNGVHLWSCEGVRIAANRITGHRDGIYLEFAAHSDVEDNLVEQNSRYGLHFMSSHSSNYRKNRFSRNGAGVAVMYSRHVEMTGNVFEYSWGSSAYGLLIKDLSDSKICGNTFHHNSTAIYSQGATRTAYLGNQFRENGWALRILSNGDDNTFQNNNFSRNSFDVGTNGELTNHLFVGNYWDRYEGYDLKRDGIGDVPFRPVSLYAMITERVPVSLFLLHSILVQLLDHAEKAFPSITPNSVIDQSPVMRPHTVRNFNSP